MEVLALWYMLLAGIFAAITGEVASKKGRSFTKWAFFGAGGFVIALVWALMLKPTEERLLAGGMKKCPACAELVQGAALKCRYCSTALT